MTGQACYASGIDNNSFTGNEYICATQIPGRAKGWCGPIQSQSDCPTSGNTGVASIGLLSPAAKDVVEHAGPRPHASFWADLSKPILDRL